MAIQRRKHAQDGLTYVITTDRTQGADYIEFNLIEIDGKACPPDGVGKYIKKVVRNENNKED